MLSDQAYELLRRLASPVVAVTTAYAGRTNGMILDSAVRASISPQYPRLSVYIHKWHLSHSLVWKSGKLLAHLLHRGQFELIHRLGFVSGHDKADKLSGLTSRTGELDLPLLDDCYGAFECRVVNTMDAGASTCFLTDVVATHGGRGEEVMTADYFRANLPEAWREEFLANYRQAQERIAQAAAVDPGIRWPGPK